MDLETVQAAFAEGGSPSPEQALALRRMLESLPPSLDDAAPALLALAKLPLSPEIADAPLAAYLERLRLAHQPQAPLSAPGREACLALYRQLGPKSRARGGILRLLASAGSDDLREFARLLAADPPENSQDVALACTPLFQRRPFPADVLFPQVLSGIGNLAAAAVILDLANYGYRQARLRPHPGAERREHLMHLLNGIVTGLKDAAEFPQHAPNFAERLAESLALAVSLCDALALIGDASAADVLHKAHALPHRRIRTEAAGALARLGDPRGIESLIALAAEPVARLRVLAYAEELGLLDRVPAEFRTQVAYAEAELAAWLAEPSRLGIPPQEITLWDRRTLYWPGHDDPVECLLFRYAYRLGAARFSGVGIAGPCTMSWLLEMSHLTPGRVYAAYAGWYAEHDEIRQFPAEAATGARRIARDRLSRRAEDAGYDRVVPRICGEFFGTPVLIAEGHLHGQPGFIAADEEIILWHAHHGGPRALGPAEVYCIYVGHQLLQHFNEDWRLDDR